MAKIKWIGEEKEIPSLGCVMKAGDTREVDDVLAKQLVDQKLAEMEGKSGASGSSKGGSKGKGGGGE